ncbi:MAG TPA: hypothetical protein VF458_01900 [Ktedonobacteraceae bacterium]
MQVATQNVPVARRWALNLYLVLAGLVLLGIFLQGFLIGAFLFGGAEWGVAAHSFVGLGLLVASLLLALVGLAAHRSGKMKLWGFLFFALVIVQMALAGIRGSAPLVAALHPANALLLFGLNLYLIWQTVQLMRNNA